MIAADRLARRRADAAAALTDAGVGLMLVTDLRNIAYLTGFFGSAGVLLLDAAGDGVLCTDSRYEVQVREQAPGVAHVISREYVPGALGAYEGDTSAPIGIEAHDLTLARAAGVRTAVAEAGFTGDLVELDDLVADVRRAKDDTEIAAITRACDAVDLAWEAVLASEAIAEGRTERQVAAALEHAMRVSGSDGTAFDTIVASGPNGARPHHSATDRALEKGDLVVVDFGAMVDGYASDCTRTVAIGRPVDELRAIHEIVLAAQEAAVAAVAPGLSCADLDAVARDRIAEAGYGENFGHSLGHGVGLDVHEGPAVSTRSTATLRSGDVVTIEPGIYLPGLGGVRIEDTVAVTDTGHRVLTTTSKTLMHL